MNNKGLRQRIIVATSSDEIAQLLTQGESFEFASRKTRSSWKNAGRRRLSALKGGAPVAVATESKTETEEVSKPKRQKKKARG